VPQLHPGKPPPPDYYASNVRFLLDEVSRRSGELLAPRERALIEAFHQQPVPAQRLFARLATRTGPWIRVDSLNYPEVGDVDAAVARLADAGLVRLTATAPADALLKLLTRAELAALFPRVQGRTKPAWLNDCLGRYPDTLIRCRLAATHPWIEIADRDAFATCAVLFFGSDEADLSTFVVQDLGVRCYERYPLGPDTRPFRARAELERYLLSRRLSPWSSHLSDAPALAGTIPRLLWGEPRTRTEQRARDKVLNRVGRWHERRGEHDAALTCYGRSTSHPARERRARLLHRLGDETAVADLLAAMRDDPWGPEEADFAGRFPGRRPATTTRTSTCALIGATPARIERHALSLLTANGGRGWHLENLLPLGLAGLAFWDVVFAPLPGVFTHPFQLGPQDLFWPDFARSRRGLIDARLSALNEPGAFEAAVRRTFAAKRGVSNALVHWGALKPDRLDALLSNVPHRALLTLAHLTLCNLRSRRTGFPDLLLIYGPGAWELVEVKGPTDQLQPAQREWLRTLDEAGLPARVLRFRAC
jgi:hypothetical protein